MPPGLRVPSAPPGLGRPASVELGGGVARVITQRSSLYGLSSPQPPLAPSLYSLLDALLTPRAEARLCAADASQRLHDICGAGD